jgi:hypothetical protein
VIRGTWSEFVAQLCFYRYAQASWLRMLPTLHQHEAPALGRQKAEYTTNHILYTACIGESSGVRDNNPERFKGCRNVRSLSRAHSDTPPACFRQDFSKIEAGHLTLEQIDFHLGALVEQVAALFQGKLEVRFGKAIHFSPSGSTLLQHL